MGSLGELGEHHLRPVALARPLVLVQALALQLAGTAAEEER